MFSATAHHQLLKVLALGFCFFLFGCASSVQETARINVTKSELSISEKTTENVVPGYFFSANVGGVATIHSINDGTLINFYQYRDSKFVLAKTFTSHDPIKFFTTIVIDEQEHLLFYADNTLQVLSSRTPTARKLFSFEIGFQPSESRVPKVDIVQDLNGDGRHDIVIPTFDWFWISLQRSEGDFLEPVKYGPSEPHQHSKLANASHTYFEAGLSELSIHWLKSRIYNFDVDLDGLIDLVFWNDDRFDVYTQMLNGSFHHTPMNYSINITFDDDGIYTRMFDFNQESTLSMIFGLKRLSTKTHLIAFSDFNNDGISDLITQTLSGRSLTRQKSRYDVHFGRRGKTLIDFSPTVSLTLSPNGRSAAMQPWGYSTRIFQDNNHDGYTDFLFYDIHMGIEGIIRAMLLQSIRIDLEAFSNTKQGLHPSYHQTFTLKPKPSWKQGVFFPPVLLGDFNGDGIDDVIVGKYWNELWIYKGTKDAVLFDEVPESITVSLPRDERNIWAFDLDKDAKDEIIVYKEASSKNQSLLLSYSIN